MTLEFIRTNRAEAAAALMEGENEDKMKRIIAELNEDIKLHNLTYVDIPNYDEMLEALGLHDGLESVLGQPNFNGQLLVILLGCAAYPESSGFPANLCDQINEMFMCVTAEDVYYKYRALLPDAAKVMVAGQQSVQDAIDSLLITTERAVTCMEQLIKNQQHRHAVQTHLITAIETCRSKANNPGLVDCLITQVKNNFESYKLVTTIPHSRGGPPRPRCYKYDTPLDALREAILVALGHGRISNLSLYVEAFTLWDRPLVAEAEVTEV